MRSRPKLVLTAGLIVAGINVATIFFLPTEFISRQLPWMLAVVPMFVVSSILILRVPDSSIGWLLLAIAVFGSFGNLPGLGEDPSGRWYGSVGAALSTAGISLLALLLMIYPDGKLPSPGWAWARRLAISAALVGGVVALLVGG